MTRVPHAASGPGPMGAKPLPQAWHRAGKHGHAWLCSRLGHEEL